MAKLRHTRRNFLQSAGAALGASSCTQSTTLGGGSKAPSNPRTVTVGAIGLGIMGFNNCESALAQPGVRLKSACDLYAGRRKRAQERFGRDLVVTEDYRQLLGDPELDAVIVSTTDHWHAPIAIDALKQGKAVYLEKPMVHRIEEGQPLIDAHRASGRVCQVGSQRVSSAVYQKARELYAAGEIGQLVVAEAHWDRHSAMGAWQYSIPRDASPETVAWQRFLGSAPSREFDPVHFFRWRNYRAYGTGIAGDLFVHLFSGLHLITDSLGPSRIYASGGLRHWKDGRDVPDVLMGVYDYPETSTHSAFNLQLRVNFVDGGGGGQRILLSGTEGQMTISDGGVTVVRNTLGSAPGYGGWDTYKTFDEQNQRDFVAWYEQHYKGKNREGEHSESSFEVEPGYSDHRAHHANFFEAVRSGSPVVEDPAFGLRACAVALASNMSHFEHRSVGWDPEGMRLT